MRGLGRLKARGGRCYELSLRLLLANMEEPDILLVHGETRSSDPGAIGGRMGHAWIEVGHFVYDRTARDEPFHRALYYLDGEVSAVTKYGAHDAAVAFSDHGHWGPWP
jgi:hypothetical protein